MKKLVIIAFIFCLSYANCMAQENIQAETLGISDTQSKSGQDNKSVQDDKLIQDDKLNYTKDNQTKPIKPNKIQEIWQGKIYTSTYRAGVCIDVKGQIQGVLKLRTSKGDVDTYHFFGHIKNGKIFAKHSSGHIFKGKFISDSKVGGKITLKSGYKVALKGKRLKNVQLTTSCAPLPPVN